MPGLIFDRLLDFTLYYPLFMAYLWMIGGAYYYFHWERREPNYDTPPELPAYPKVAIIVPCHNEAANIRETVDSLLQQSYPDFEVILVNDGSTDNTQAILDDLARTHDSVRVLHFADNQGKAMALRMGAMITPCEFVVTIDGDAILDPGAVTWIMYHLVGGAARCGRDRQSAHTHALDAARQDPGGRVLLDHRIAEALSAHLWPRVHHLGRDQRLS